MSVGESLGSHSLHSFAEFLQHHINSPEASSCLSSKRKPLKPLNVLKPFSLKFMAAEKSVRKGARQRRERTSKDLPDDLAELYKTDPEEDYNQRKTRIQWIQRYWSEQWFKYKFVTQEYAEKNAIKSPWGDILYRSLPPKNRAEAIAQVFILVWSVDHSLKMPNHHHCSGVVTIISSSATSSMQRHRPRKTRSHWD